MPCVEQGMNGKVYLVGAGPGDAELLTLKAVRALACADVALVDELVNEEVLKHLRPDARVVKVGKRGGCASTPQAFIEGLMVRLAREGNTVVRLKGGDPFVFGRGGEEMLALRAADIPYEIVPGVTAGIGAVSAIEVPVTHRGLSVGVSFVTGHLREAGTEPNWQALAASGTTLVIYMGMATLPRIVAGLIAGGMSPQTPAAAVQRGTLETQKEVVTTLAQLQEAVRAANLGSPAVLVIGPVVALAKNRVIELAAQAMQHAA